MAKILRTILLLLAAGLCAQDLLAAPTVSNVTSSVRSGTKLVDVDYDLAGDTAPRAV